MTTLPNNKPVKKKRSKKPARSQQGPATPSAPAASESSQENGTSQALPALNGPAIIYAVRWLIVDTFRQAVANRIFWFMLIISAVTIVFCLGISVESGLSAPLAGDTELYGPKGNPFTGGRAEGSISIMFNMISVPWNRHDDDAVRFIQVILAGYAVGLIGFLLALIWTAGFVPDFLQPSAASVLFAKPIPRWTLIVGKYLGVVAFVAVQISIFVFGTWFALGIRTNVWESGYLLTIPLFVIYFSVIYSFTVLIATCTRSSVACIFGSILFWLLCMGMNHGRHYAVGMEHFSGGDTILGPLSSWVIELSYWILPKPADIVVLLEQAIGAQTYIGTLTQQPHFQYVITNELYWPQWSILASLGFVVAMLVLSAQQLASVDY